MRSFAVTSNLYPETTIQENNAADDRSNTVPSRSTLHSLRNLNPPDNLRNGFHSRPSLFQRTHSQDPYDPDLNSFKAVEDDDYGFKSRFNSSQVRQINLCFRFTEKYSN